MAMFVMRVHLNSFRHEDSNWHKLANVSVTPRLGRVRVGCHSHRIVKKVLSNCSRCRNRARHETVWLLIQR